MDLPTATTCLVVQSTLRPDLFVGAVENPFAPPVPYRVERAKIKSDAGARFLQTQIGYQPKLLEQFVSGCIDNGVTERTSLLVTVVLVKRAGALRFMNREVPGISVPDRRHRSRGGRSRTRPRRRTSTCSSSVSTPCRFRV